MSRREHHWNAQTEVPSACGGLFPWRIVAVALVTIVCVAPAARGEEEFLRDAQHTFLARNLLDQDPALSRLNLGVKVYNRVATLWGPVPDVALGMRAADLLRMQPEFRAVYNELYFEDDISLLFFLQSPAARPARREETARVSLLPPVKIEEKTPARSGPAGSLTTRPMDKKPPVAYLPEKIGREEAKPPSQESLPAKAIFRSGEIGPPPTAAKPDTPASLLSQTLRTLQQSQERFRNVKFEVKDGVVTLSGPARQAEALYELARAVAQVPGVIRVLVREN